MRSLIFASMFFVCCRTAKPTDTNEKHLREYAFCRCLYYSNLDSLFKNEISTSIYLDIGGYDLQVYDAVDNLAKTFAVSIKPSIISDHEGKSPVILECFKFYNGKQIDSLVRANQSGKFSNW